ncbi:MAG: Sua5/YciO/YrdC/YwlC family protein [Fodinibius sp.]|nr:Sua5/YciO/YrdC/YwlC family protein [Fodinibius sp.]
MLYASFPTETVYGLGADAWNPDAIQKVFTTKGRPADNPLIVHLSQSSEVEHFASEITDDARQLIDTFWPGPLTLILSQKAGGARYYYSRSGYRGSALAQPSPLGRISLPGSVRW